MRLSVLDRLLEGSASHETDGRAEPAQIAEGIRRDIEDLLNTRSVVRARNADDRSFGTSVVCLGLEPIDDVGADGDAHPRVVAERVATAIRLFEPRLDEVTVTPVPGGARLPDVVLRIEGKLVTRGRRDPVAWDSYVRGGLVRIARA